MTAEQLQAAHDGRHHDQRAINTPVDTANGGVGALFLTPVRGEAMTVSVKALQRPSTPKQESVHAKP